MRASIKLFITLAVVATALFVLCSSASVSSLRLHAHKKPTAANQNRVSFAQRTLETIPKAWELVRGAPPSPKQRVSFTINLKQNNVETLKKKLLDVSTPSSKSYGKFLTVEEIQKIVSPPKRVARAVAQWLGKAGVAHIDGGDAFRVVTTVKKAEELFQTQLHTFKHKRTGRKIIRHMGELTVPAEIAQHIDFISGLSEFWEHTKRVRNELVTDDAPRPPRRGAKITPQVLRDFYNVPSDAAATNPQNSQAVIAFDDFFSMGALEEFYATFGIVPNDTVVDILGHNCLFSEECDEMESDLDIQYMTALGLGVPTWFWGHNGDQWVLEYAQGVMQTPNAPLVHSISYGAPEIAQCEGLPVCQKLGYNSQQYVERSDVELVKLGLRGITVFIADGDDGVSNFGDGMGNCPLDGSEGSYCLGGTCAHNSTQCGSILIQLGSMSCVYPQGQSTDDCAEIMSQPEYYKAVQGFAAANQQCQYDIEWHVTPYGNQAYDLYSSCSCEGLNKYGPDANGYTVTAYTYNPAYGTPLNPDYPASSPYVTSVGASQFLGEEAPFTEVACSLQTLAVITTGGGFALYQDQPEWQQQAVQSYLSSGVQLPPKGLFDPSKRAYPDIAFNGHNYMVYGSVNASAHGTCPCEMSPADGTSAASPSAAGLFALINDALLNAGLSPLGFMNPLLYQIAAENPSVFNDITSGNNKCNRYACCEYGFEATKGWDPVTGLGSPNFANLREYILKVKQEKAQKRH